MMRRWYAPLDPECSEVVEFVTTLYDDPMTQYSGMGSEVMDGWSPKHRADCKQCQKYGAENIDVAYG